MASSQLIPGLPNDLGFLCLLCLPAPELVRVQKVSPLWRIAIQSDRFYVERRRRRPFPSVFAICCTSPRGYQCMDADIADLQNPRLLFSCDYHEGHKLFPPGVVFACVENCVYGFAPGHHVQCFSLLTRRWIQVSKILPDRCKVMVSTLGSHVVVIACSKQNDDDDDDDDDYDGSGSHDAGFTNTFCEIFDTHTNRWAPVQGLPERFYVTHCITHQGSVFVRGETGADGPIVYGMNLMERRWVEDAHVSAMLDRVQRDSKVVLQSTSVLMATSLTHLVNLSSLDLSTGRRVDVLSFNTGGLPGEYFLFKQGEQIFLGVQNYGEAPSWQVKQVFFYHGLNILNIPGDLLMVDAIAGGQAMF